MHLRYKTIGVVILSVLFLIIVYAFARHRIKDLAVGDLSAAYSKVSLPDWATGSIRLAMRRRVEALDGRFGPVSTFQILPVAVSEDLGIWAAKVQTVRRGIRRTEQVTCFTSQAACTIELAR